MCGKSQLPANNVRSYRFGLPPLGKPEISTLLHQGQAIDKYGKYNNILAKILLREAYQVEYDLYDHNDPTLQHPLQSHLINDKVMIKKEGPMKKLMSRYHEYNVQKYFGITLLEFMNLPIDQYEMVLELAMNYIREEARQIDEIEKQQQQLMSQHTERNENNLQQQM